MRRSSHAVALAAALGACAAHEEATVAIALPTVEPPPPPTRYGRDPPVPAARYEDQLAPGSVPPASWACGESDNLQGIRAAAPALRACYNQSLSTDPNRGGKIVVRITLDGSGRATKVQVASSTLGDASLEGCIVNKFASGTYPCLTGEISVPITFAPAP